MTKKGVQKTVHLFLSLNPKISSYKIHKKILFVVINNVRGTSTLLQKMLL